MDKKTILHVNDDRAALILGELMLTRGGFTPLSAITGEIALEILDTITPDLIISDVMMPSIDGFSLNLLVRARQNTADIPFVFTVLMPLERVPLEIATHDRNYYLPVPFLHTDLWRMLRSIFAGDDSAKISRLLP